MKKEETAPVAAAGNAYLPCDAAEICVTGCSKIVVFRDENIFLAFLEGNKHLVPLYGKREYEKQLFPNMFVAAIKEQECEEG